MTDSHKKHGAIKEFFERRKERKQAERESARATQAAYLKEKSARDVESAKERARLENDLALAKDRLRAEESLKAEKERLERNRKYGTPIERFSRNIAQAAGRVIENSRRRAPRRKRLNA